jgi:hypothetical protein
MPTVTQGPWKLQSAPPAPARKGAHPLILAALVAAVVAMAGWIGYQAISSPVLPGSTFGPEVGERTLRAGVHYANQDIARGVWTTDTDGRECGYRKTTIGTAATDAATTGNTVNRGSMAVTVTSTTLYVEFTGPCMWTWSEAK